MLLQTNSYIVPTDRRAEHARLIRRFRQALARIGCDQFEVYEQVGANWSPGGANGRYVQIMRFRDRQHQQAVQAAERGDPGAQQIIAEFCDLINFPYQQQHGYFATGFYTSVLPIGPRQAIEYEETEASEPEVSPEEEITAEVTAEEAAMIAEDEAFPIQHANKFAEVPIAAPEAEEAAPSEHAPAADETIAPDEMADEEGANQADDTAEAEAENPAPAEPVSESPDEGDEIITSRPAGESDADLFPSEPLAAAEESLDSADLFPPAPFAAESESMGLTAEPVEETPEHEAVETASAEPETLESSPSFHSMSSEAPAESVLDELDTIDHGLIFEDEEPITNAAADAQALDDGSLGMDVPPDASADRAAPHAPANGHPDDLPRHLPHDDLLDQIPFPGEHDEGALAGLGDSSSLGSSGGKEAELMEFETLMREMEDPAADHGRKH